VDSPLNDIQTRDQVELLVERFYEKVKSDSLLAPIFSHVDWPKHMPTMYNFWSSMLLGDRSYAGNPMTNHLALKINRTHFEQWLKLFRSTVDELYKGEKAEEAKMRAESIAGILQHKMNLW
jgi:hemoglobin